jgi:hypothetical protein
MYVFFTTQSNAFLHLFYDLFHSIKYSVFIIVSFLSFSKIIFLNNHYHDYFFQFIGDIK